MQTAALVDLATELLRAVMAFDAPADGVIANFTRRHKALGPRERQLLSDTVFAVLRRRLLFTQRARGGPGTMERRLVLLAWPGDAASLRAALPAADRDWLDACPVPAADTLPPPLVHNLPDWLAAPLQTRLGDEFPALAAALLEPAPLDLRVNTLKARRDEVRVELARAGIESAPTPLSPWGLRVAGKPSLARLPAFTEGRVEVQDEGSQLLALALEPRRHELVVDFCAGAGGKTLALGAAMRNTGRLYAFDVAGSRLAALAPRLARSGLGTVHTAQIAHERDERVRRLEGKIDRVLVDAPCTGVGTLRRQPDLKWRQDAAAVTAHAERQRAILAAAARLLKPGGRLVYATCSLLAAEGEDVADAFSAAEAARLVPLPAPAVLAAAGAGSGAALGEGPYLRLWPHRHGTDGFFAAIWQRR